MQSIGTAVAMLLAQRNPMQEPFMPAVTAEPHKKGDHFVDYEEKVFEDVKAKPG